MPEFQLLGHGGGEGGHKSRLPLYLGLGALAVGFLIFRGRGSTSPSSSSGASDAGALEFARISSQASGDMSRLVEMNNLERYRLDLAQQNTPAGLRQTLTGDQWKGLPSGVRQAILGQARRGGELVSAGPGGVTFTPTSAGLGGSLQPVQRTSRGLFSSSSSGVGAPAPQVGGPGILDALALWLRGGGYYG